MNTKQYISLLTVILGLIVCSGEVYAAKTVKIKLTGSLYEPIQVVVGQTQRVEVISSLPYMLEVEKRELPLKLRFQSDSYLYHDIDVPEKPYDTTGHVYLVKVNESAMSMRNTKEPTRPIASTVVPTDNNVTPGIDFQHGVNAAPITGMCSEKTFALIIANEKYDMAAKVDNAINDGSVFKEYCTKTLGIPVNNIRYSTDLSFGKMRKVINDMLELVELMKGEGNLIMYYAGHGIPDNKTKDAYLMPVDADGTDTDICISLSDLYSKIETKNLNRCIVFLDACFSGAQRGGDMIVVARGVKLRPKEVIPEGKTIVFSATSNDEAAYSHKEERHGLFTYFLLSKLQESKGKITLGELAEYLTDKVAFESRRINNAPQTPRVIVSSGLNEKWKSMKLAQ